MNHLPNGTIAVGAPGSEARKRAETEDKALKLGCGKHIRITGTNGGTMPCGGKLTTFGKRTIELCPQCASAANIPNSVELRYHNEF
jgi:hypothetical protein